MVKNIMKEAEFKGRLKQRDIMNIFNTMGWDRNCRYKALGRVVTSERGLILVFDLEEAIMFSALPEEYFDVRTGTTKKRRLVYYPDEYKGRIGKSYNDYMKTYQTSMFESLDGYTNDVDETGGLGGDGSK